MKAVVMAGGEGTRLRPLTSNQPKPMVPIVGRPCMEHIVNLLKEHGFEDIVVTLAFMPQAIRTYFGDGEPYGVRMRYSVEESPAGTAGSVRLAADELDDTFVVISGDALCDVDLSALVAAHRRHEASVTIGLEERREPARVRHRRLRRGRPHRALPREALLGAGLLGHDQHRDLRARAGGAPARPRGSPVRLLEGALPAPARDGTTAVRARDGRLLAGHRQPRPVPAGQLRRARRTGQARRAGDPAARQRLARRGRRARHRADRGAGLRRELLPDQLDRGRRPLRRARLGRHGSRARLGDAGGGRCRDLRRPERDGRGRDRRTLVRPARARANPRGSRDRRRLHARAGERRHARDPDLPVQGGRVGHGRRSQRHLGIARRVGARRGRHDVGPRQRRPHAGGRSQARDGARHHAEARVARRRQPLPAACLPAGQAGAHRRHLVDGRPRRGSPRGARRRQPPSAQVDGRGCRHPRAAERGRPRGGAGGDLRASGHPGDAVLPEGGREASRPPGVPPRVLRRPRRSLLPLQGRGNVRRRPARDARRGGDPGTGIPHRGRLHPFAGLAHPAARPRPARGRGGRVALAPRRPAGPAGDGARRSR